MPKISINIVTYNGIKYIPFCIKSIIDQNYKDFEIVVVDNNSIDGTKEYIKANYPFIKLIENKENMGFSYANNQAIQVNDSEYILITNQDIILENNFLEIIINFADNNKEYASFGGKLKKMRPDGHGQFEKLNIIDSLYLDHTLGYKFINFGEGFDDSEKFNKDIDIFGISGALVMYRRSAIEKIKHGKYEYFDNDFFMYKEDIDLAWRLQNAGYKAIYLHEAIAYHERGFIGGSNNIKDTIKRKNNDKEFLAKLSYRNHLYILLKNLDTKELILKFPFIFYEESKKMIYYLIFKKEVLKFGIKEFKQNYKKIKNKKYENSSCA